MDAALDRIVSSRTSLLAAVAGVLALTTVMWVLFVAVVVDVTRVEPGPPSLPQTWIDEDGTGIAITLHEGGTGTVENFPAAPVGAQCLRDTYTFVTSGVEWRLSERGSVEIELNDQYHVMYLDRRVEGEPSWDAVRVNVCGSERDGGDFRPFVVAGASR